MKFSKFCIASVAYLASISLVDAFGCSYLPNQKQFQALIDHYKTDSTMPYWGVVLSREGRICAVAHSGETWDSATPASRPGAAMKAFTANYFSSKYVAVSSGNLFESIQPGGQEYGVDPAIQPDSDVLLSGRNSATRWGTNDDPLVGRKMGGFLPLPGGVALYNGDGEVLGAVGISGDTHCVDHLIAIKIRQELDFENFPDSDRLLNYPFCTEEEQLNLIEVEGVPPTIAPTISPTVSNNLGTGKRGKGKRRNL